MTDIIVKDIKNGSEYYYGGSAEVSAEDVSYDNTISGLSATTVQDAIDEVNSKTIQANPTGEAPTTTGNNTKTLQSDGVYRLTAYHTTSGTRLQVRIKLNGNVIASKNRAPSDSDGYCSCLLFDGKVGDVISVNVDGSEDPVNGRLTVDKMDRIYVQYN